jgi:hypothetical protein
VGRDWCFGAARRGITDVGDHPRHALERIVGRWRSFLRPIDPGRVVRATDNHRERRLEVDEDRSTVVVLSTYVDTRDSVLRCGELLSAVLLDATMAGLATCTLTHITEVPASRKIVAGLIDHRNQDITPQILIRVGLTPSIEDAPPPTPRRKMSEVFEVR